MGKKHLIPLGSSGWFVWREAVLRTTGFPSDGLVRYAAADCAVAARAGAPDFPERFAEARTANFEHALTIAADPRFQAAVTWQSPSALGGFDSLVRRGAQQPNTSKRRYREEAVARYWQRYCGKNDTISFFGPICWVSLDPDLSDGVSVRVGPGLVRRRWVLFEDWALRAVGDAIAADPRVRPWLAPALLPHLTVDGDQVRRPMLSPVRLTSTEAYLLAGCDGRRPARDLLADAVSAGQLRQAADGELILQRLVEKELLRWGIDVPLNPDAEAELAEQLATIGDIQAREEALSRLQRLREARDQVAAAADEPQLLKAALERLEAEFTSVTGASARRGEGQTYAGRGLCYEDTTRDLAVTFGKPVIDEIATALEPMLQAARWLTAALAQVYNQGLRDLYDDLHRGAGELGGRPVWLADLWLLAQGLFFGAAGTRLSDSVTAEFVKRWDELFGLGKVGDLLELRFVAQELSVAAKVAFPAQRPGWALAGMHSPDVQICAEGPEAINRGEFTLVLGELHAAWCVLDSRIFVAAHPDPDSLRKALRSDLGGPRLRPLYPLFLPRYTGRGTHGLDQSDDGFVAYYDAPGARSPQVIAATAISVSEVDGQLVATVPDGRSWPLLDIFAWLLAAHAIDAFKATSTAERSPRITVDRMVIARATWRTTVGATGLADLADGDGAQRYRAVLAWADRLGLPDLVYVKLGSEVKPFFVDLTSPVYSSMLCGMLRAARNRSGEAVAMTVSEMLPTPPLAWVPDAAGGRYFSELRLQVIDPASRQSG